MNYIDKEISHYLLENNILPNTIAYKYLRDCIKIAITKYNCTNISLKNIYNIIALKYNKTPCSIEKSISNAINKAFNSVRLQNKYSSLLFDNDKLSNKEFILQIINNLV